MFNVSICYEKDATISKTDKEHVFVGRSQSGDEVMMEDYQGYRERRGNVLSVFVSTQSKAIFNSVLGKVERLLGFSPLVIR